MSAERNPLNRGVKPGQTTHLLLRVWPPQQTLGTSPNDRPNATSPPSPNEEAEGTTHLLGQTVPHLLEWVWCYLSFFLSFYGWYHTPAQAGRYHTPTHDSTTHPPMWVWCY
ncbi:hypothetical protein BS47DRAFT_1364472 [Hydnum rufescens UP504]|uniref:Uncharacterized protein n=1 Tax=Hydnum rufescens UP504 TaxID=1448309 RepID=A0A9P6DUG4_9AGAM|nr:hypothetical protein BS47DRAFT_1364472 [Hydnum rufescens UP504]